MTGRGRRRKETAHGDPTRSSPRTGATSSSPAAWTIDQESLTNTYGKFACEPLERGFGITLGNALRRVLLSSLQGAAITSVKIEGVLHEFTTIPEVVEDVTDIILNLKEVLLQIHTNEAEDRPHRGATGPGEVKAGDIIADGQVEILNPDHHIAHPQRGRPGPRWS